MAEKTDIYFKCGLQKWGWLPEEVKRRALEKLDVLTEIRLRAGGCIQLVYMDGDELFGTMNRQEFSKAVSAMLGHSLYARQAELAKGYFTLDDGSRVGVCGDFSADGPRTLENIGSVNIRIAREIRGCADQLMEAIGNFRSAVIISPPGIGKTTVLRNIARQLSQNGACVCIIDERDEIAACRNGIPAFDIGPRTDVISGIAKHRAIMMAVRSCAPDVIIADEIGGDEDASAIHDALRCGVRVIASAHGNSLDKSEMRPVIAKIRDELGMGVLLGPGIGMIKQISMFGRGERNV